MTEESGTPPATDSQSRINTPGGIFLRDMEKGTKLKLKDGALVEIVENAGDGGWVFARYLESPDEPELVGTEDWVFFGDVNEEVS